MTTLANVRTCEALVFGEAARCNMTVMELITAVTALEESDSILRRACEILQEAYIAEYTPVIVKRYWEM